MVKGSVVGISDGRSVIISSSPLPTMPKGQTAVKHFLKVQRTVHQTDSRSCFADRPSRLTRDVL